jgi:hypothetical protein
MKKLRPEVENDIKYSGGIFGLMNNIIYTGFNITSDELDYICENATDDELDIFVNGLGEYEKPPTFSEIKKSLEIRNKFLQQKNESIT